MTEKMNSSVENNTPALMNGTNIVAIDNKIEQAMDLVKTHLLYAVREEVEVLKERIVELEAKIVRLETENKVLRKHAPTEVVQFIQQQQQQDQEQKPPAGQDPPLTAPAPPQQAFSIVTTQAQHRLSG